MIIRVTNKVHKKFGIKPTEIIPISDNPYIDWSVNNFSADRAQYISFFNTTSLLSVTIYSRGINENNIYNEFLSTLREYLSEINSNFIYERHITPYCDPIRISKTLNKQVTGSMNNLILMAKSYLENEEISLIELNKKLNEVPMSQFNYSSPMKIWNNLKPC